MPACESTNYTKYKETRGIAVPAGRGVKVNRMGEWREFMEREIGVNR